MNNNTSNFLKGIKNKKENRKYDISPVIIPKSKSKELPSIINNNLKKICNEIPYSSMAFKLDDIVYKIYNYYYLSIIFSVSNNTKVLLNDQENENYIIIKMYCLGNSILFKDIFENDKHIHDVMKSKILIHCTGYITWFISENKNVTNVLIDNFDNRTCIQSISKYMNTLNKSFKFYSIKTSINDNNKLMGNCEIKEKFKFISIFNSTTLKAKVNFFKLCSKSDQIQEPLISYKEFPYVMIYELIKSFSTTRLQKDKTKIVGSFINFSKFNYTNETCSKELKKLINIILLYKDIQNSFGFIFNDKYLKYKIKNMEKYKSELNLKSLLKQIISFHEVCFIKNINEHNFPNIYYLKFRNNYEINKSIRIGLSYFTTLLFNYLNELQSKKVWINDFIEYTKIYYYYKTFNEITKDFYDYDCSNKLEILKRKGITKPTKVFNKSFIRKIFQVSITSATDTNLIDSVLISCEDDHIFDIIGWTNDLRETIDINNLFAILKEIQQTNIHSNEYSDEKLLKIYNRNSNLFKSFNISFDKFSECKSDFEIIKILALSIFSSLDNFNE